MGWHLERRAKGFGYVMHLVNRGTKLKPTYQLVIRYNRYRNPNRRHIEDLGYYIAFTDLRGKRYIRIKTERCKYWIAQGCRITNTAYKLLQTCGLVPPLPMKRKLTLGELRLARNIHHVFKQNKLLTGLNDGISPINADLIPGNIPHDEWKKDVLNYQYKGRLYHTNINNNNNNNIGWKPRCVRISNKIMRWNNIHSFNTQMLHTCKTIY